MPAPNPIQTLLALTGSSQSDAVLAGFSHADDLKNGSKPGSQLARALLRKMLSAATGTDPTFWTFERGENGKPEALLKGFPSPLAISISHSGPYVACAIAKAEALGIDIEMHRNWRDLKNIADLAFGPQERHLVEEEGPEAFYRIWTLREAYAKATGLGLEQAADGKDRFAISIPGNGILFSGSETGGLKKWQFSYNRPALNLSVAIAVYSDTETSPSPIWDKTILSE